MGLDQVIVRKNTCIDHYIANKKRSCEDKGYLSCVYFVRCLQTRLFPYEELWRVKDKEFLSHTALADRVMFNKIGIRFGNHKL